MKATLRTLLLAAVGAVALSASAVAQTPFQQGVDAYNRGDFATAIGLWRPLAEQGNAAAQLNLGHMYDYGWGVQENDAEAVRWWRLAADQGDVLAQFNLGLMYANGRGVQVNHAEAVRWWRLAAEQGNADAQYKLGLSYRNGWGLPKDYVEAARWNRLAANQGDAAAQLLMGLIYQNGEGVPKNQTEATRWYRLAAEQGNADAQYGLGVMYMHGEGVTKSPSEAVRWYRLAAEQGNADAQVDLGISLSLGHGTLEDNREAAYWFRLAAETGNARGQLLLGAHYVSGEGVPQSYVEAFKWYNLAAAQGLNEAGNKRDILSQLMTSGQLAEAQRLSTEFRPRSPSPAPSLSSNRPQTGPMVKSTGSGFFITATGHLVTNAHVVEGCSQVSLAGGSRLTVLDVDGGSDLALLKAGASSTRAPLLLRQGRGVRLADSVVVAGYPLTGLLSSGLNVTTGAVSALAGPGDDRRLIQITAPVQPGNSGGPLFDTSGNVVGVVVSKLDAVAVASVTGDIPQNVNFAISLGTLQAFLDASGVDYQTRASTATKSNADVAELAKAATVQIECRN